MLRLLRKMAQLTNELGRLRVRPVGESPSAGFMIVHPLSVTNVDWPTLIEICQSELGHSPTRGIDDANLNIKDPASFPACLLLDNRPLDTLRQNGVHLNHCSMSFIADMTMDEISQIIELWEYIYILQRHTKKLNTRVVILTGTIKQWISAIESLAIPNTETLLRRLVNDIQQIFESTNFKYCFEGYRKIIQLDKTFILLRK